METKEKKFPHPPHDSERDNHPIALIHDIDRIMREKVKQNCPQMQHSYRLIMMELSHRENVTQLDLVHATHLKAPTVSVCLQKMELDGLVTRKSDERDQRATRVSLTEKGREVDRQIISRIREEEAKAECCLDEGEKDTILKLLVKIRDYLNQGGGQFEE